MVFRPVTRESKLRPVSGGCLRGFCPIYQKELARWFGTRRWISQLIIWVALTAAPAIGLTPSGGSTNQGASLLSLFLYLGATPMAIGTIVLTQGAILEEKLTQTLLWVCSKPLSRSAFILAKFAAYAVFIGSILLGGPAIVTYVAALMFGLPSQITLLGYLVSVLMVYLLLMFILALTLMLGTFLSSIGAVTASALFVFFGGATLSSNQQLQQVEPYSFGALPRYAAEAVVGRFSNTAWIAMSSTLSLIALCLLIASWQMERHEL